MDFTRTLTLKWTTLAGHRKGNDHWEPGSGKSTLLNILAGLDQPSAGQITVGEFNLLTITPEELVDYRRNEVGFVWQQTSRNLIPYLSAEQNITVPLILDGTSRSQAIDRANLLLDAVHLSNRRKQKPNEHNPGQRQWHQPNGTNGNDEGIHGPHETTTKNTVQKSM